MALSPSPSEQLAAALGNAVRDLPSSVVARVEAALQQPPQEIDPLIERLQRMHHAEGASGAPWQEAGLAPERQEELAQVSRSLHGLSTTLRVLISVVRHNRAASTDNQLGDHITLGLLMASSELADSASDALHHGC